MNILVKPIAVQGVPENPGVTVFCIIDFSHISVHTFTKDNEFCLDVFSCKQFNYREVLDYIKSIFDDVYIEYKCGIVNYDRLEKIK